MASKAGFNIRTKNIFCDDQILKFDLFDHRGQHCHDLCIILRIILITNDIATAIIHP